MLANIIRVVKRLWTVCLAILAGLAVPFLIWAAIISGFRQLYHEWRSIRVGLLAGNLTCSLDTDCPPGYVCLGGKCISIPAR